MMLRLMLVSLVTSMGLELPSSRDVTCWGESASAWVHAVLSETRGATVALQTTSPDLACAPVETDLAFQAASGELVNDFTNDRAVTSGDLPTAVACSVAARAAPLESGAVGLPDGEKLATVVPAADPIEGDASTSIGPFSEANEDDELTTADRLTAAVRLTREAAQAWAAVIQEPADAAGCSR